MSRKNRNRQQARPEPRFIEDLQRPEQVAAQLVRLKEELDGFNSFADAMAAAFNDSFATGADLSTTPITDVPAGIVYSQKQAYSFALVYPCKTACVYINEHQHKIIRARSRAFASISSYWQGIVHSLKTHIVARGHNYIAAPRHKDAPPPDDILRKAQYETDRFVKVNKYRQVQQEKLERQHEDGEHILRYITTNPDGVLRVRFVEPLLLWSPTAHDNDVWFGIRYEDADYEDPKGYFIQESVWSGARNPTEPEEVLPTEIQHRKINVTRNSPRGIPSTYPIQTLLEQSTKTLGTMGTLVEIRSRIGLIRSHVNAASASVQQMLSPAMFQKVYGSSSGNQATVLRWQPGTVLDKSDQSKYELPNQNVESDKIVHSVQANLRAAAVKFGFPEYLVSAESGGTSYASGMVAEGPAVKSFEFSQQDMIDDDTEVLERALQHAASKGRLPENILELVKIDIKPPSLAGRNAIQESQAKQIEMQSGVRSIKTWREEIGLDHATEDANQLKEAERQSLVQALGIRAQAAVTGMMPGADQIAAGQEPPTGTKGGQNGGTAQPKARTTARPFAAADEERNKQRPLKEEAGIWIPEGAMLRRDPVTGEVWARLRESSQDDPAAQEPSNAHVS